MKRRTFRRTLAGLLSTAAFMQAVPLLPAPQSQQPFTGFTASAAGIETIQTRVFEYDFGSFKAYYDTRSEKWFNKDGKPLSASGEVMYRIENPAFGKAGNAAAKYRAAIINMQSRTLFLELADGSVINSDTLCASAADPAKLSPYQQATASPKLIMHGASAGIRLSGGMRDITDFEIPAEILAQLKNEGDYYVEAPKEVEYTAPDGTAYGYLRIYLNRGRYDMKGKSCDFWFEPIDMYYDNAKDLSIRLLLSRPQWVDNAPPFSKDGIYVMEFAVPNADFPEFKHAQVAVVDKEKHADTINMNDYPFSGQHVQLWLDRDVPEQRTAEGISLQSLPWNSDESAYEQPLTIPQDVAKEIGLKSGTPTRIYREPEDTDDPELKKILAAGKDLVGGFRLARSNTTANVMYAELCGNDLLLNIAYQENSGTVGHAGAFLAVDDGILPENLNVKVFFKEYAPLPTDSAQTKIADCFSDIVSQITHAEALYKSTYYDKAQQKDIALPYPKNPPINYNWRIVPNEGGSDVSLQCDKLFGDYLLATAFQTADSVDITKTGYNQAESTPYTSAGDATIDGSQDVADAVLASRIIAEDEDAPVTDLGMDLADKNEDGVVNVNDVTGILYDIAHTPANQRTDDYPQNAILLKDFRTVNYGPDEMAQKLGYDSYSEFDRKEIMPRSIDTAYWCKCTEGETTDTWYFVAQTPYTFSRVELSGLSFSTDACLVINAFYYAVADPSQAVPFAQAELTVPHGALPPETFGVWALTQANSVGTVYLPPYITVEELPEDSIRLLSFYRRRSFSGESELKRVFDCDSFDAFCEKYGDGSNSTVSAFKSGKGSRGRAYDLVWYKPDFIGFHNVYPESLSLTSGGVLTVRAGGTYDKYADSDPVNYIWLHMEVPEDAPEINYLNFDVSNYANTPEFPEIKYIHYEQLQDNMIPVYAFRQDTFDPIKRSETHIDYDQLLQERGYHMTYEDIVGDMAGVEAVACKKNEGETYDDYSFLLMAPQGWFGWDAVVLDKVIIKPYGALCFQTKEYAPYHGDISEVDRPQVFVTEFHLRVPHGAIADDLELQWNRGSMASPEYQRMLNSIEIEQPVPLPHACSDVQYEQEYRFQDPVIVPADVRAELNAAGESPKADDNFRDTPYRVFTDASQTADPKLKTILEQGHDVLAVYFLCPADDTIISVADARLVDKTQLVLSMEMRKKDSPAEQAVTYQRVIFVTDKFAVPELHSVVTRFNSGEFDAAVPQQNISYGERDTIPADLRIHDYASGDTVEQLCPHDVLTQLTQDSPYAIRAYYEPDDTDSPLLKEILGQYKDVFAVYVKSVPVNADGSMGICVQNATLTGTTLNLSLAYNYFETQIDVASYCRLVFIFDDLRMPKITDINVSKQIIHSTAENSADAVMRAHSKEHFDLLCTTNSIRADVETMKDLSSSSLPQDVADELGFDTQKYVIRQYRNTADTDDAHIQELLANGKDVTAIYLMRGDTGSDFGAYYGALHPNGEMELTLAEHRDETAGCAMTTYCVLLITDDGLLPELTEEKLIFNLAVYQDGDIEYKGDDGETIIEHIDTRQEFEFSCKNPLYIECAIEDYDHTVYDA